MHAIAAVHPAAAPVPGSTLPWAQLVVHAYDPRWPREFERLRQRALAVLGDLAVAVEHVGSTAVPGLAGKPVIDYLRADPEQTHRYANLKLHAARDAAGDWERYAQLKRKFFRRVLGAALAT